MSRLRAWLFPVEDGYSWESMPTGTRLALALVGIIILVSMIRW